MNSLAARLIGSKYRYIFPGHLYYFTAETMRQFARREFPVMAAKSTHFNPLVVWQDFRGGERDILRAKRVKLLQRTTGYKQSPWLAPVKVTCRLANQHWGNCFWQTMWPWSGVK